ncbi:MAG: hypothetical protein JST06_01660 [Bacteroidetes bacterium]|nr:hypothetical protein [Bacteroidota bacterium]
MKPSLLLILVLLLSVMPAQGAYVIKKKSAKTEQQAASGKPYEHVGRKRSLFQERIFQAVPRYKYGKMFRDSRNGEAWYGLTSLISGSLAAILLAIFLLGGFMEFAFPIIAIFLGIGAIIFGAKGINRKGGGFAIAGLSLGILTFITIIVLCAIIFLSIMEIAIFL